MTSESSLSERDEMLDLLEDAIDEAHEKVQSGRVYNPENEKVRQGWIRVLAYSIGQYRQLAEDRDLDELKERMDAYEERQKESMGQ